MRIFTIGFTQKSAEQFFNLIRNNGVKELVDIRLGVTSQLAAFAKGEDLKFFLKEICGIPYSHDIFLAPTEDLLKDYKKKIISWQEYEKRFADIMWQRNSRAYIEKTYAGRDRVCLLCSESTPEMCHRRLVAEIFCEVFQNTDLIHL